MELWEIHQELELLRLQRKYRRISGDDLRNKINLLMVFVKPDYL